MSKWSVLAERAWAAGDPGSPQLRRRAADTKRYTVRRDHRPQRWAYLVGDWHGSRRSEPRGYHDTAVDWDDDGQPMVIASADVSPRALLGTPREEWPDIDLRISARGGGIDRRGSG